MTETTSAARAKGRGDNLSSMLLPELKALAGQLGISGSSAMRKGDLVLFYESVTTKAVVGRATVSKTAFPDTTADEDGWVAVELKADRPLPQPVTLAAIKAVPALQEIGLLRQSRLSVVPLSAADYARIVALG